MAAYAVIEAPCHVPEAIDEAPNDMTEQTIGRFIYWLSLAAFPVLIFFTRYHYISKTRGWVDVAGKIMRSRDVLLGDSVTPFVDVCYEFAGKTLTVSNLNTSGTSLRDYPTGGAIRLLVDPSNPHKCTVKLASAYGDEWLLKVATRRANRTKSQ